MIKKIATLALMVSVLSSQTFGQDSKSSNESRKLMFGLKAGANLSWFKPDSKNLSKGGFKPGFSYGIMGDYNLQPNYALSLEFLISTLNGKMQFKDSMLYKNTKTNVSSKAADVAYEYTNKYIQIPISMKFRTKEIGMIKYYAQFGLAPGIRISSKVKIDGNNLPWSEDDRKNIKTNESSEEDFEPIDNTFSDDVSFLNIPLIIGGGIEYNLSGNTSAYVNLRFENGFTNVLKSTATSVFSKNMSLSVGIFF